MKKTARQLMWLSLAIAGSLRASTAIGPGVTIRDAIGGKDPTTFIVDVPAGTAVRVTVRREGIYLTHRIFSGTQRVTGVDDNNGASGTVMVALPIQPAAASYELHLQPVVQHVCGTYELSVEQTAADDRSRAIADGQRLLFEGRRIEGSGEAGSIAKSLQYTDDSFERADRAGDLLTAAGAVYRSAIQHGQLSHTRESFAQMERAVARYHELGMLGAEARAIGRLGEIARRVGEVETAERYFRQALPLSIAAVDFEGECDTRNNHGLLLTQIGRWADAIAMLTEAIPIAERTATIDVQGALHHNVGFAYAQMGDYDRSLAAYERSIEVKRKFWVPRRAARTYEGIAMDYIALDDLPKAQTNLEEALKLWEMSGDPQGLGTSSLNFARLKLRRDDLTAAATAAAKALELLRTANDHRGEGAALLVLAQIDLRNGNGEPAVERLLRSLEIARDAIDPAGEAAVLYSLGKAMQTTGRIDEAINYAQKAVDVVETMRQAITDPELRSTYLRTLRQYFDLLIDLLMSKHERAPGAGFAAEAFRVNELSRARTLLESLARSQAGVHKGIPSDLLERERSLRRRLNAKEAYRAQLLRGDRSRPELLDTDRLIARLRDDYASVEAEIRRTSPEYASLIFPEPVTLANVQSRLLTPDTLLLEYHLGEDRSYVWAISQANVGVHVLPKERVIEAAARAWHDLLRRNPTTLEPAAADALRRQVAKAGEELSRVVYDPVAAAARGKRLLVVADGALHYVPLGALTDEKGAPLMASHEIVYLPSATVLDAARRLEPARGGSNKIAVFADPVFQRADPRFSRGAPQAAAAEMRSEERWARGNDFRRLQFSRKEAEAIIGAASQRAELQALDFAAAKRTLIGTDLRGYDIIHIATHGIVNAEEPELSGLVLSLYDARGKKIDGFVRLHEIYDLDLDAGLVVLSACRTALGKTVYGEGLISLTRGFMYGGARRVMATVWSVDDRATATMMAHVYDAMLRHGAAPASALRSAQLTMSRDPRWRDPYFWAAFTLHGD